MVASHLTKTETRFLYCTSPILSDHIHWEDLFMSTSLCLYGLQHISKCPIEFRLAITKTAPYEALILPDITALFRRHVGFAKFILDKIIKAHRPISMLAYLFQLYSCSCRDKYADDYCNYAAAANNTEALAWLRDPTTSDGVYPWSYLTTALAAEYGHIDMLERLRDSTIDGGICPWGIHTCSRAAIKGQLAALVWLRDLKMGGGVCPWDKEHCLWLAPDCAHSAIVAWIHTQPDDN
jgi:hypothetical protein